MGDDIIIIVNKRQFPHLLESIDTRNSSRERALIHNPNLLDLRQKATPDHRCPHKNSSAAKDPSLREFTNSDPSSLLL